MAVNQSVVHSSMLQPGSYRSCGAVFGPRSWGTKCPAVRAAGITSAQSTIPDVRYAILYHRSGGHFCGDEIRSRRYMNFHQLATFVWPVADPEAVENRGMGFLREVTE